MAQGEEQSECSSLQAAGVHPNDLPVPPLTDYRCDSVERAYRLDWCTWHRPSLGRLRALSDGAEWFVRLHSHPRSSVRFAVPFHHPYIALRAGIAIAVLAGFTAGSAFAGKVSMPKEGPFAFDYCAVSEGQLLTSSDKVLVAHDKTIANIAPNQRADRLIALSPNSIPEIAQRTRKCERVLRPVKCKSCSARPQLRLY